MIFYIFIFLTIFFTVYVLFFRNPIFSIFTLILAYITSTLILLALGIEFLSLLILIVYIGAIAILFLFVVMMLNIQDINLENKNSWINKIFMVFVIKFSYLYYLYLSSFNNFNTSWNLKNILNYIDINWELYYNINNVNVFTILLYTKYWYTLIFIGLFLLIAIIGSVILSLPVKLKAWKEV